MKFKLLLFTGILLPILTLAQGSEKNLEVVKQLLKAKNYEGAVSKANEILAAGENTEVYLLRANAYHQLKNYKNEISDYKRLLELDDNPDARLSLASAYFAARDSSEANRTLELNLKLHPDHIKSILYSSMLAGHRKDLVLALKILTDAYRKYDSPILLHARAIEYRKQGKYEEALSDYESLISIKKSSSLYMYAAQCASSTGDYKKTMEYYKKYIEVNPNNSGALSDAAGQLQRSGNFTEAEVYYKKAIDIMPTNVYPLAGKAFLAYKQGNADEAFSILDASLLFKSKAKISSLVRGYLNTYEGNLAEAETDFKEAITDDKQKKYAYAALAKLFIYRGEYSRAVDFTSTYISGQRTPSAGLYNTRGFAYYKMGKAEEAIKDFLYAKELEKDFQPMFNYIEKDGKSPVQDYTHVQFFLPFSDVNDTKFNFFTDGKKDFDFKIRIISNDEVDASKINLYESGKLIDPKYWSLKSVEKRDFKYMDMLITDVAFQYTPTNKKSNLKLSYAGTETQTQTIIK